MTYGVKKELGPLMVGEHRFDSQVFQSTLLHDEVPVTRVELVDLLCDQFKLPKTRDIYLKFERLDFVFGQKYTTASATHYWTTESSYTYADAFGRKSRRDRFSIKGWVR